MYMYSLRLPRFFCSRVVFLCFYGPQLLNCSFWICVLHWMYFHPFLISVNQQQEHVFLKRSREVNVHPGPGTSGHSHSRRGALAGNFCDSWQRWHSLTKDECCTRCQRLCLELVEVPQLYFPTVCNHCLCSAHPSCEHVVGTLPSPLSLMIAIHVRERIEPWTELCHGQSLSWCLQLRGINLETLKKQYTVTTLRYIWNCVW